VPLLLALWRRRELPDGSRRSAVVGFVASPGITGRLAPFRCCWLCGGYDRSYNRYQSSQPDDGDGFSDQ
jgi:hypothetical protein